MDGLSRRVIAIEDHYRRGGTHPESLSPDDLDPADFATLTRIMARAYAVLGWPIRPDAA